MNVNLFLTRRGLLPMMEEKDPHGTHPHPAGQATHSAAFLTALVLGLGGCVVLMGLTVMVGWHTRTVWLVQWHPTLVAMVYNTACCFLLLGVSLLLAKRGYRRWSGLLGSLVALFALVVLLQYPLGVDWGIDQLFVQPFITTKTHQPGRMAANTAICFLFGGLMLLLHACHPARGAWWLGVGGSVVTGFGLTALIGYLVDTQSAYGWGLLTRMALPTALTFLGLGGGLLALAWEGERARADGSSRWLPTQLFILLLAIVFATWVAIASAQAHRDIRDALYETLLVWFPGFGLLLAVLLALLVYFNLLTRQRARQMQTEIAERRRAEAALQIAKNQLQMQVDCVNRIQSLFIEEEQPETVFHLLLQEFLRLSGSGYGFIAKVKPVGPGSFCFQTLAFSTNIGDEATRSRFDAHARADLRLARTQGFHAEYLLSVDLVIINDLTQDPRHGHLPVDHPLLDNFLGVPIQHGQDKVGMLGLANRPGGYDMALVAYLEPAVTACATVNLFSAREATKR
ncbi:MAG: GAF domain-containing protein [Magnetococcales bacterium]|nr:GAF domain-containing protein [Magnetococcales bacterium]